VAAAGTTKRTAKRPAAAASVTEDLATVETVEPAEHVEHVEVTVEDGPADAHPARTQTVPPIDARVLLEAIMTPPGGVDGDEPLTDELTGAVPTWRLDEEPIYLEVVRDLGVPALPEAEGGAGEVIVGEVVG
jgi:hypothetical protein